MGSRRVSAAALLAGLAVLLLPLSAHALTFSITGTSVSPNPVPPGVTITVTTTITNTSPTVGSGIIVDEEIWDAAGVKVNQGTPSGQQYTPGQHFAAGQRRDYSFIFIIPATLPAADYTVNLAVFSSPDGIDCGIVCSATYRAGTVIALTAMPAAGSVFAGWSGAGCAGGTVALTVPRTCTATFALQTQPPPPSVVEGGYLVTGAGPGGGPHVWIFKLDPQTAAVTPLGLGFCAYDPALRGGVKVAAVDIDGDGRSEIVTGPGAGGGPHVRILEVSPTGAATPMGSGFFAYDVAFAGGVSVALE